MLSDTGGARDAEKKGPCKFEAKRKGGRSGPPFKGPCVPKLRRNLEEGETKALSLNGGEMHGGLLRIGVAGCQRGKIRG